MQENLTRLLNTALDSSLEAQKILPLVYNQLRAIAAVQLRQERPGHSLMTTDLVHEAYLKLFHNAKPSWQDRKHFFSSAALAMRGILVDHTRKKTAKKRTDPEDGIPEFERIELGGKLAMETILDLDRALSRLQELDKRQSQIVQLRVFAGLTGKETAELLNISERTEAREWWSAKLWLQEKIGNG